MAGAAVTQCRNDVMRSTARIVLDLNEAPQANTHAGLSFCRRVIHPRRNGRRMVRLRVLHPLRCLPHRDTLRPAAGSRAIRPSNACSCHSAGDIEEYLIRAVHRTIDPLRPSSLVGLVPAAVCRIASSNIDAAKNHVSSPERRESEFGPFRPGPPATSGKQRRPTTDRVRRPRPLRRR